MIIPTAQSRINSEKDHVREILRRNKAIVKSRFAYIRKIVFAYLIITLFFQLVLAGFKMDFPAAGAAILVAAIGALTIGYLFRFGIANMYPVSSLIILTFCMGTQLIPIGGTLIEGKLITYNLEFPLRVFWWISVFQLIAVVGHIIYRNFPPCIAVRSSLTRLLTSGGFFMVPSINQLWVMGGIGLLPFFVGGFFSSIGAGFAIKILQGFGYFAYAPFIIPFYHLLYRNAQRPTRKQLYQVGAYFVAIVLIGMAINSRGGIGDALMTVGFSVVFLSLLGKFDIKQIFKRHKLLAVTAGLFVLFPMSYLALAIQTARKDRGKISQVDMIFSTLATVAQPGKVFAMERFRVSEGKKFGWDEGYLSNVFLHRFANVKLHDVTFLASKNFGSDDIEEIRDFTEARVLALIPGPLIRLAGLNFYKDYWTSFSLGDLIYHLSGRQLTAGRKSASQIVNGLLLFGPILYPLVLLACVIVTYILFDSFTKIDMRKKYGFVGVVVSPLVIISISEISRFFSDESIAAYAALLLRYYIQYVVIYFVALHATNFLSQRQTRKF